MTYQAHQSEDLALKTPVFTEEELLAGDRERNDRKNEDPYRQAEADLWLGREH